MQLYRQRLKHNPLISLLNDTLDNFLLHYAGLVLLNHLWKTITESDTEKLLASILLPFLSKCSSQ